MALVKYNNNSISDITTAGQVATGSLVPIKTLTASSSATLSFVHGTADVVLDSTYPIYQFEFININPDNDDEFMVNFSTDGGSNYNVTKTTTFFRSQHDEGDIDPALGYVTSRDLAQSTAYQKLTQVQGNGADESCSGSLYLFAPSSSTFVKHFMARTNMYEPSSYTLDVFVAGYCNTTSPVNAVSFKIETGNFDGTIKLYGIKDS